ncbi:MAG: PAS domain S-box protein [Spirochaetales bacterium]|nr:PAS domain S-box protein [Spirochaetales bacterium]
MRKFFKKALKKFDKLSGDQVRDLLADLTAENELLEIVLNSMTDGIIVTDTNNKILFHNRRSDRLIPFSSVELDDSIIWEVIDDDDISEFIQKTLLNAEKVSEEEFTIKIAGISKTLWLDIMPVVREGSIQGSLLHISDITERKKRDGRLRRAENLASLTTLAAGVAHEIKNPLGSISIHIQLMQKSLKRDKQLEEETSGKYLDILNEEVERLNNIIVDFLFAVRPMNPTMKKSDINKVLTDLLEFVKYELEEASVTIECEFEEDLPKLEIDEKYIKQAILNIIKNSVAAMPDGGVMYFRTVKDGDFVHIYVCDTGTGISEENMSKIFEPYFTTKQFGSGLGLTVVYKIIKEHGGDIVLESVENQGTTFTINLPVPQIGKQLLDWKGQS